MTLVPSCVGPFIIVAALAAVGCPAKQAAAPSVAPDATAAAGFCKEHAVPEEMCTKCHPELVAKFIEQGDFCREHGLPESVCPSCHPELAAQAGVEVAFPVPGSKVRLRSPDLVEAAGIETARVEEDAFAETLDVVGRLEFNQNRLAQVSARGDALVVDVKVDVGDQVKAGQALVVVQSAAAGLDRARLSAAKARLDAGTAALDRQASLQGIASQKDIDHARSDVAAAQADYDAALAALRAAGADVGVSSGGRLVLAAPFAGTVVARDAVAGRNVAAGHVLLEIADVSTMWGQLEVPEEQAMLVRPGQRVSIRFEGKNGAVRDATIARVGASVDRETRTVRARVELDNQDGLLKAGLFFRAQVHIAEKQGALLVPRDAVQQAEGQAIVFVDEGGGVFEPVAVKLGRRTVSHVEIIEGLTPGKEVVTVGAFLLKTEVLKDSIGAGCADD